MKSVRTDQLTRMIDDATAAWNVAGLRAYFVGIGGCGMSGLVRMLQARGAVCTGSDRITTPITEGLLADGIDVGFDQRAEALPSQCDLLVISAAVPWDHPQVLAAQEQGIEVVRYAQALGRCMLGRMGIAVAGTHGKSTTSAMLAYVLTQCGLDPSFIVGATCRQLGGGSHVGTLTDEPASYPKLLIAEACEYDRSFHSLHPTRAIITSVESDHLDVYGTLDAVVESFTHFAQLLPDASQDGHLLIAHDNAHRREVTAGLQCEVETIGFSPAADWTVTYRAPTVELAHHGEQVCTWSMRMPGEHNAMNAACAAAAALALPGEPASGDRVGEALSGFHGLDRRLQFLGERDIDGLHGDVGTVRVYDDYGHHPSEIDATLRAVRQHEQLSVFGGRLVCVFQPHQHSRTRFLLEEFAQSFSSADVVIVPHIYFVRDSEAEKHKVSARDLVDRLRSRGVTAMHLYPFDAIVETLQSVCRPGDVLVVMGAGPVWQVAHDYLASGQTIEDGS